MGAIPDIDTGEAIDPMQRSSFRTSWSQPEGTVGAVILEGKVIDVNLNLWTVDVVSQFDQKYYLNVQVSSPYQHTNAGEGIYVMPDVGAKCHICIPSDGPPPFVLDFIMSAEDIPQGGADDAPEEAENAMTSTFSGGRKRAKPGDIYIKGRNGNFVILHRGGVLQIGSSQLSQRIYIPLQNLVADISQNYRHYNTGGSVNWYLARSESKTNPRTMLTETYRLLAGDAKGSIRITTGTQPIADVTEENSEVRSELEQNSIGTGDNKILYEVVYTPDDFEIDDGAKAQQLAQPTLGQAGQGTEPTRLRFFFDKVGGAFLHAEGSVLLYTAKKLRLMADDNISISTKKNFQLTVEETTRIDAGKDLAVSAGRIIFNGGEIGEVTFKGADVEVFVDTPLPVTTMAGTPGVDPVSGSPLFVIGGATLAGPKIPLTGTIKTGNPQFKM